MGEQVTVALCDKTSCAWARLESLAPSFPGCGTWSLLEPGKHPNVPVSGAKASDFPSCACMISCSAAPDAASPSRARRGPWATPRRGWRPRIDARKKNPSIARPRNRENRQSYKTPISPHLGFTAHPRDHGYVPVEGRTPNTILWRSTRPNVFGGLKPDCPEQSHTATTLPPHCQRTETTSGPWHDEISCASVERCPEQARRPNVVLCTVCTTRSRVVVAGGGRW